MRPPSRRWPTSPWRAPRTNTGLSLAAFTPRQRARSPRALSRPPGGARRALLSRHPEVTEIEICTNNDAPGRLAAEGIRNHYKDTYQVTVNLPAREGLDFADLAEQPGGFETGSRPVKEVLQSKNCLSNPILTIKERSIP